MHVSPSSPVADHCSVYALSDDKEPLFSSPCDHDHDRTCPQCEELTALVSAIQEYLEREDLGFPTAELDDLCHVANRDLKIPRYRCTGTGSVPVDVKCSCA